RHPEADRRFCGQGPRCHARRHPRALARVLRASTGAAEGGRVGAYLGVICRLIPPPTVTPSACCWLNCRPLLLTVTLIDSSRQSLARTSRSRSHWCAAIS